MIEFEPPILSGRAEEHHDEPDFSEWVDRLGDAFNVFIEPPPQKSETQNSRPQQMLKYLARYLTGGPIADGRLISHAQHAGHEGQVTFWARSKDKSTGNAPREFSLPGVEFVRRWSMHILPKGFTKTRCYGGFSCRHRADYLQRCRQLLHLVEPEDEPPSEPPLEDESLVPSRTCPHCQAEMICETSTPRPSWRDLFSEHTTCPLWYQPARSISPRIHGPDSTSSACSL